MVMNNFEASAILNNQGVEAINFGDYGRACEVLMGALHSARGVLATSSGGPTSTSRSPLSSGSGMPGPNQEAVSTSSAEQLSSSASSSTSCPPRSPNSAAPTMLLVYSTGVPIALPSSSHTTDGSDVDCRVHSGTIIFNLALVHHLKGMHGHTQIQALALKKAMSLYEKSYVLLQGYLEELKASNPMHSERRSIVHLLTMALLNNMGQLSWEQYKYEQSRVLFDSLIKFALHADHAGNSPSHEDGTSQLGGKDVDLKRSFLLNAMIHHNRSPIAAAA